MRFTPISTLKVNLDLTTQKQFQSVNSSQNALLEFLPSKKGIMKNVDLITSHSDADDLNGN